MNKFIIILSFTYLIYLYIENKENLKIRKSFKYIIHVNGIRGKSTTSRLINSAIRDGNNRVYCKTTGSSPMTIDVNGKEEEIKRIGKANIKEQIKTMRKAYNQNADILIIECMAVLPEFQKVSQYEIVNSNISIVTNVRRDHLLEMGRTLDEIAKSLSSVMPENGYFITGDANYYKYYKELGESKNTKVILSNDIEDGYGIDFKENVNIALSICDILGIDRNDAIERMKNYHQDPGILKGYLLDNKSIFINGFAANDPDSILVIYDILKERGIINKKNFILLINNRKDRGYRAKQYIEVIEKIQPDEVWLSGSFKIYMVREIKRMIRYKNMDLLLKEYSFNNIESLNENNIIFGIGNIVGEGEKIIEQINKNSKTISIL